MCWVVTTACSFPACFIKLVFLCELYYNIIFKFLKREMGGRGSAGKKSSGGGGSVMRGSEKQLAWANDIINAVGYTLNEVEKSIPNVPNEAKEIHRNIVSTLKNADYAGDVISPFSSGRLYDVARMQANTITDSEGVNTLVRRNYEHIVYQRNFAKRNKIGILQNT